MLIDLFIERPQPKWPDVSQTDKEELQGVTPLPVYWQEPVKTENDLFPPLYISKKSVLIGKPEVVPMEYKKQYDRPIMTPLSTYHEKNPTDF